jgi:hypothetical protein
VSNDGLSISGVELSRSFTREFVSLLQSDWMHS